MSNPWNKCFSHAFAASVVHHIASFGITTSGSLLQQKGRHKTAVGVGLEICELFLGLNRFSRSEKFGQGI